MGEIRRPVGHPPKAGAFGRFPGSRENPWAFFGYFLSQQKVTPRRGGETRQKTFRTRQDCEGPDHRVAVKGNDTTTNQDTTPRTERQPVQEAALRACLEGQTAKTESAWRSPRLGNGQSRSGRGLSLRFYIVKVNALYPFHRAMFLAAALVEGYCL